MPRRVQRAERHGVESLQLRLVDDVIADERMFRPVVERHFERERLEQLMVAQHRKEIAARAKARVECAEPFGDRIKEGRRPTVLIEYTHPFAALGNARRSEEHTSELQSLMRISYAVF